LTAIGMSLQMPMPGGTILGDDKINKEIDTGVDRAHRWKKLAENLQKRYSSPRYLA
jgi:hypothetical protein